MKKLSKLIALLLALAIVFCLVACGAEHKGDGVDKGNQDSSNVDNTKKTDAEKLLGKWIYSFDLSNAIGEEIAESLGDDSIAPNDPFYMNLILDFDDRDFTLAAEVDTNSLADYMEALIDNMVKYLYDMAEGQGMSQKDFEDAVEADYGMTLKEYVGKQVNQLIKEAVNEMNSKISGYYELDDKEGYIYIGKDKDELNSKKEAMEYSFSGEVLSISGIISEGKKLVDPIGLKEYGIESLWKFEKK